MALQGYQAVSFFPQQITNSEYHLAVLDHVFNPNEEDHRDAGQWVQDVDSLVTYLEHHPDPTDEVSKKFFKSIADEEEVKKIKNYLHAVQGSGRDVSRIRAAIAKAKIVIGNDQNAPVFTKTKDVLICPPSFLYSTSSSFRAAVRTQLSDNSWNWFQFEHPYHGEFKFSREDAVALVNHSTATTPADLMNLVHHTDWDLALILQEASPLESAILRGDIEQVKRLIPVYGARETKLPGTTNLELAVMCGKLEIVKILTQSSLFSPEEQKSAAKIAARDAHPSILRYFLDLGIDPEIPDEFDYLIEMKMVLDKGIPFSSDYLFSHRAANSVTYKRLNRLFTNSISSKATAEINEALNILLLSHTWRKEGQVALKRKGETDQKLMYLEGSYPEINCEIMSTTWKKFCEQHPHGVPKDFQDLVGDALRYAAEDHHLKAAGYFERYKNDLPVIFPVFIKPVGEYGHYVGVLIWKDYFCIFNGGDGCEGRSIFHGKFQVDRLTVDFLKKLMWPKSTVKEYQQFVDSLKSTLNLQRGNPREDAFLGHIFDHFNDFHDVGVCSFFNLQKLVQILLSRHLYDKIDQSKNTITNELYAAIRGAQHISREWELFQQAWLLRNYLYSDTRQEYELCHDFIKGILKDSWDLWLDNERSQVTKNILYQCERRYLELLSPQECSNYKADKVAYLVKAWRYHSLYPNRVSSLKKDRLR
jgi:hypothetical protein